MTLRHNTIPSFRAQRGIPLRSRRLASIKNPTCRGRFTRPSWVSLDVVAAAFRRPSWGSPSWYIHSRLNSWLSPLFLARKLTANSLFPLRLLSALRGELFSTSDLTPKPLASSHATERNAVILRLSGKDSRRTSTPASCLPLMRSSNSSFLLAGRRSLVAHLLRNYQLPTTNSRLSP
jgi:hypothetical protein